MKLRPTTHPLPHRCPRLRATKVTSSSNNSCNNKLRHVTSNRMETPSQRQVSQGPQSPPSGPGPQKSTRDTPKPRWSVKNSSNNNNNDSKNNNSGSLHPRGNVDDNDKHRGHNYNVPSGSAMQTCCASTCRRFVICNTQHDRDNNNLANHKAPTTAGMAPATAQQTQQVKQATRC